MALLYLPHPSSSSSLLLWLVSGRAVPAQQSACPTLHPQLLCSPLPTFASLCWDQDLGMCFTLGSVFFTMVLFITSSHLPSLLFIQAYNSHPPTVGISEGSCLVNGRDLSHLLCICGGSFIAEVTVSGTPAISMLWSRSNELLHILVPLLQMIGVVCSFMCCFFTQLQLWVPCTFPLPVSFFMVVSILFPACNRSGLSSPHQSWSGLTDFLFLAGSRGFLRSTPYWCPAIGLIQNFSQLPEASFADCFLNTTLKCFNLPRLQLCSCLCYISSLSLLCPD